MPGFDKTGPEGRGAMTGRRMGRCTNFGKGRIEETSQNTQENDVLADQRFGYGRGFGRGLGRGRGFRRGGGRGFQLGFRNRGGF